MTKTMMIMTAIMIFCMIAIVSRFFTSDNIIDTIMKNENMRFMIVEYYKAKTLITMMMIMMMLAVIMIVIIMIIIVLFFYQQDK